MSSRPLWSIAAVFTAVACSGEPAPTPDTAAADTAAVEAPPVLSPTDLANGSENIALVPSVIETQRALEAAGITTQLADLIADKPFDLNNDNKDNVALRSGVLIANLLLTVKSSKKEQLQDQLTKIRAGMATLEGGSDIDAMLADIEDRVKGDGVTRDDLLKEFDQLSGAVIPELEFNGQQRIVPLIQAGSWVQGANLVAKAVKQAGKPEAASAMLKQPAVVDYFIQYVKGEGATKAPAAITEKLEESLTTLKGLAEKKEPFTAEDIDLVIKTTDDVLALL